MSNVFKIHVTTDEMGRFFASQALGESFGAGSQAQISVRVLEPSGVLVQGVADVENDDDSSENQARNFECPAGESCDTGNWLLGGNDKLKLYAGIGESRAGLMLELEVRVSSASEA